MKLQFLAATAHEHKDAKLTCTTCKLKKCVGRCKWKYAPVRTTA